MNKKKHLFIALLLLGLLMAFNRFSKNLICMIIDRGYKIPDNSSIFTFKENKMNEGSGDWWLYGEDFSNYYGISDSMEIIYFTPKKVSISNKKFNKYDYNTWSPKYETK